VVDKRQKEHFDLVFKIAKDNQIVSEKTNLTFLGFGTVNDTVNKPLKTRGSGEFNSLIDTLEIAISKGKKKDSNTEIIVLSNIKFSFLSCKYSSSHKYIPDQLTRYDGYSGAYILYTIMRIRSLFNKHSPNFTEFTIDDDISITTSVRDLLLQLIQFPDCIVATSTTKNTQHLTKQAYNIAYSFNILYEQISFLTQAEKYKTYLLKICSLTLLQLETLAFLLGMRIPEKM
jgi:arginyl-tRNA synthetase